MRRPGNRLTADSSGKAMTSFGNSTLAIVDSAVPVQPNALTCLSRDSTRAPAKKAEVWIIRHAGQASHGRRGDLPLRPLPGSQSRRRPDTHRRGQPLQSEARNAKNAPESAICGVLPDRPAPTGSVFGWSQFPIPEALASTCRRPCLSPLPVLAPCSGFSFQLSAFQHLASLVPPHPSRKRPSSSH
jgi:hypothetical protein